MVVPGQRFLGNCVQTGRLLSMLFQALWWHQRKLPGGGMQARPSGSCKVHV